MKKPLLFFVLTCIHTLLFGYHSALPKGKEPQQNDTLKISENHVGAIQSDDYPMRRGYIGLSIGPAFAIGDFAKADGGRAKTGLHINLINFGYLFSKHVGIAGVLNGGAHHYDNLDGANFDPWGYGSLLVGPLFSFPLSKSFQWDLKPMIGYSRTTLPTSGYGSVDIADNSISFNAGTAVRYHIGRFISLSLNADFFTTNASFDVVDINANPHSITHRINAVLIGAGVAYRLR